MKNIISINYSVYHESMRISRKLFGFELLKMFGLEIFWRLLT